MPKLPDPRASVLIQRGRDWRRLHNGFVSYFGGWVIFCFSLLLALFLLFRGRIPLKSGFSGRTVPRFDSFERFNHWFTATSFVLLALTGLVLLYGQYLIKPWLGAGAYGGRPIVAQHLPAVAQTRTDHNARRTPDPPLPRAGVLAPLDQDTQPEALDGLH